MKKCVILACLLATAGCSFSLGDSQENTLANNIREELTKNGVAVQDVQITRQDDDHMNGFADVRGADGTEGRLACTATRDATKGSAYYDWRCRPAIDQRALDQMEGQIRDTITSQGGQVRQVELNRVDDSRMTGFAVVADAAGNETRASCTATRQSETSNQFSWQCAPEGQAPVEGGAGGGDGK